MLDVAEGAVDMVERVLRVASPHAECDSSSSTRRAPSSAASAARFARGFDVLAVIEPTGERSWVVSNGDDRATCNSAAFAERVRVSLG
jgi:hypothetical protein